LKISRLNRYLLSLAATFAFEAGADTRAGVTAGGANLQRLQGDYRFTEGPTADAAGNVYFTDQPNDRILRWNAADGTVEVWMNPAGRANGLFLTPDGDLLAAADEKNQLWSIAPDGAVSVLVESFNGGLLNGPNDIWMNAGGDIYFTDPLYPRDYWEREPTTQQPGQNVYLLPAASRQARVVLDDLVQPNGIIGTPDGKTLYVADIGAGLTYAHDIEADGSLTNGRVFCELGSDGMTIDSEGNVYLTGDGVSVFDPDGRLVEHIEVPQDWTANVTIGGPEHDLLFITASTGIYGIRLSTGGVRQPGH